MKKSSVSVNKKGFNLLLIEKVSKEWGFFYIADVSVTINRPPDDALKLVTQLHFPLGFEGIDASGSHTSQTSFGCRMAMLLVTLVCPLSLTHIIIGVGKTSGIRFAVKHKDIDRYLQQKTEQSKETVVFSSVFSALLFMTVLLRIIKQLAFRQAVHRFTFNKKALLLYFLPFMTRVVYCFLAELF